MIHTSHLYIFVYKQLGCLALRFWWPKIKQLPALFSKISLASPAEIKNGVAYKKCVQGTVTNSHGLFWGTHLQKGEGATKDNKVIWMASQ